MILPAMSQVPGFDGPEARGTRSVQSNSHRARAKGYLMRLTAIETIAKEGASGGSWPDASQAAIVLAATRKVVVEIPAAQSAGGPLEARE